MFESIIQFFKKLGKSKPETNNTSKDTAKERLHLVLMQDRANVSADFLDLMKQEIIEVIKKYIDVDENAIDVRLANKTNADGTTGAPALYANIPIVSIKNEERHLDGSVPEKKKQEDKKQDNKKPEENTKQEKKETEETQKPEGQAEKKEEIVQQEEKKQEQNEENKEQNKEENTEKDTTLQEEKNSKEEEPKQEESEENEKEKNSESVEAVASTNSD